MYALPQATDWPCRGRASGAGASQVTPVFRTVVADASGIVNLEVGSPANLGLFSVRAYAASKGATGRASTYGGNETDVVVRLPVSLTPALPRCAACG